MEKAEARAGVLSGVSLVLGAATLVVMVAVSMQGSRTKPVQVAGAIASLLAALAFLAGVIAIMRLHGLSGRVGKRGIPATLGILMSFGAMAVFLVPRPHSPEVVRLTVCRSNLKQIGLALVVYEVDNNGNTPENLQALVDSGHVEDARIFICPSHPDATLKPSDVASSGSYRYALVKGLSDEDSRFAKDVPIAWEKEAWHWRATRGFLRSASGDERPHTNVLYADYHAEYVAVDTLASQVERHREKYLHIPVLPIAEDK